MSWRDKTTTFCTELTSHSPPPTPLLPALTLSAGEHKVSGGESKVSRRVGLPRSSRAPRSRPQNGLPLFLVAFLETPVLCRHGGTTGFLLRGYSPYRCLRDGYRIWVCRPCYFGSSCPISSTTLSLLRHLLCTTIAMANQKIMGDKLSALAKANDYQRGVHRDKDSLRDCKKQIVQPIHKQINEHSDRSDAVNCSV